MAYLVSKQEGKRCYLRAHHIFGRLHESANTVILKPEVSKIHAIIQWNNPGWSLTDYSSNGTWVNNSKVSKTSVTRIHLADVICFAAKTSNEFVVQDLSPPCDLLIPYKNSNQIDVVTLKPYNLLPDDTTPEICMIYEDSINHWFIERLLDSGKEKEALDHNDIIEFGGAQWQLKVNVKIEQTIPITPSIDSLDELEFVFNISADEEATQLILRTSDQSIDFNIRSHHYLTLTLARKRISDIQNGLDETEQGWFYSDQLSSDLGLDPCHMNIQVHRARKQFSDNVNNTHLDQLFERQSGKIRLGSHRIIIIKGGSCEFSYAKGP